jgi:predicted regulator of Ras-like GTPase activity (Roadblock/LC7/MglB family)
VSFLQELNSMAEIWGAAIAATAVVGGAVISSQGAKSAAADQAGAANSAAQTQRDLFNAQAAYSAPQRNLGYGADSLLAQLYGIADPNAAGANSLYGANAAGASFAGGAGAGGSGTSGAPGTAGPSAPNFSNFYNSPGYQFSLNQGLNAINRNASANGSLYSSNTLGALNNYAQGAASTQYNNYVQQLMGLAGLGGSAVAGTNAAAQNAGNNISSTQLSAGNANASGVLGSAGAYAGALQQGGNLLSRYIGGGSSTPPPVAQSDPWSGITTGDGYSY